MYGTGTATPCCVVNSVFSSELPVLIVFNAVPDSRLFIGKLLDMARQPGKLGDLVSKTRGWGSSMAYPESCTDRNTDLRSLFLSLPSFDLSQRVKWNCLTEPNPV